MRIIAKKSLIKYWEKHPYTEQSLKAWYQETSAATWEGPQDIKNQYRNASFVANNRVVFNIRGNTHRLVVAVIYRFGTVYVKFIGTHKEYDRIEAETVKWSD